MNSEIQDKLADVARRMGIEPQLVMKYVVGDLPIVIQISLQQQGIDTELTRVLASGGEGIFYCLLFKAPLATPRPRHVSDYVGDVVEGVYRTARLHGYSVFLRYTNRELADHAHYHQILLNYPGAGVLSITTQHPETLMRACEELKRPCVLMDCPEQEGWYTVNIDDRDAMQQMVGYLVRFGHRRIGFIAGTAQSVSAEARLAGYRDGLAAAGIDYDPDIVIESDWTSETATQRAMILLDAKPRPTAIMCCNDLSAIGAYVAIKNRGLTIPRDISITGFDDISFAQSVDPPLTTIRQPSEDLGGLSAQLLIQLLAGEKVPQQHFRHPVEHVIRDSVGPAPTIT